MTVSGGYQGFVISNDEGPVEDEVYATKERAEESLARSLADGVYSEEDGLAVTRAEDWEDDDE